jgi:hypothetical protein
MPSSPADIARRLREAGHVDAALAVLLDLDAADATPPAAPAATTTTTAASGEPVEGVDYLSHAVLSEMSRDELEALQRERPEVYDLSSRMIGQSTRGRPYRA